MVKVSRQALQRKQQQADDDSRIGDIFQALGQPAGGAPQPGQPTAPAPAVDMTALVEKIGALEQRLTSAEQARIAAYTMPVTQPEVGKQPVMDYANLPDPIDDREGYAREITARQQKFFNDQRAYEQSVNVANQHKTQSTDNLWADFQSAHPEYKDDEDKVDYIGMKVAKKLQSRGVDVQKYVVGSRQQFMDEIVKEYDTMFGKPEADGDPAPRQRRSQPVEETPYDDVDNSRTQGIWGGNESGNKPDIRKPPAGDMIKDLQDLQRKSGLF